MTRLNRKTQKGPKDSMVAYIPPTTTETFTFLTPLRPCHFKIVFCLEYDGVQLAVRSRTDGITGPQFLIMDCKTGELAVLSVSRNTGVRAVK